MNMTKKLLMVLALWVGIISCTKEYEYPEKEIVVSMSFDKYVGVSTSNMRLADEFQHILSSSTMARVQAQTTTEGALDFDMTVRVSELESVSMALTIGATYVVTVTYDRSVNDYDEAGNVVGEHHKEYDNGIAFDAVSGQVFVEQGMLPIQMTCTTDQSLILIDIDQVDSTWANSCGYDALFTRKEFDSEGKISGMCMFEGNGFLYMYVDPDPAYANDYKLLWDKKGSGRQTFLFTSGLSPMTRYKFPADDGSTMTFDNSW